MAAGSLRDNLEKLLDALDESRRTLTEDARPKAETVAAITSRIERAREAIGGGADAIDALAPEERLAVLRLIQEIKNRMGVVARLAHGSAWFASLAREMDPETRPKGMYSRDGISEPLTGPSVERKA